MVGYLDLSVDFSLLPVFDEDGRTLQPLPITHVEGGEHAQLRGADHVDLQVLVFFGVVKL